MSLPQTDLYGLFSPDGRQAQGVCTEIHAELLGLVWRVNVSQTWRNSSGAPMATRFVFPLGADATLLTITQERLGTSTVLTRLERYDAQRCGLTLGVLGTGETVTLRWRTAQLLSLDGGSLRLQLPATLAPAATRALRLHITMHDPVARGTVSCTSHALQRGRSAQGVALSLNSPRGLEHDLQLAVHGLRGLQCAVASAQAATPGSSTVLVSRAVGPGSPLPLRLKLWLDLHPWLAAERWPALRSALERQVQRCTESEALSLTESGERICHAVPRLQAAQTAYTKRLAALLRQAPGPAGRTSLNTALQEVLALRDEDDEPTPGAALMLVTGRPCWSPSPWVQRLQATGHSLYVLAVGEAASQSGWAVVAQATGGLAVPCHSGHQAESALGRLLAHARSRQAVTTQAPLEGAQLQGQPHGPMALAEGDTQHLWARMAPQPGRLDLAASPDLRLCPEGMADVRVLWDDQGDVDKLRLACEALALPDEAARAQQLTCHDLPWISSERWQTQQSEPPAPACAATVQVAPSTPVAPLPTATHPSVAPPLVAPTPSPAASAQVLAQAVTPGAPMPTVARASPPAPPPAVRSAQALRAMDLASCLAEPTHPQNPLQALLRQLQTDAHQGDGWRPTLVRALRAVPTSGLDGLVMHLSRTAGSPARAWALLLHWVHHEQHWPLDAHLLALLQDEVQATSAASRVSVTQVLERVTAPRAQVHAA